jgi:hypothetical protein
MTSKTATQAALERRGKRVIPVAPGILAAFASG